MIHYNAILNSDVHKNFKYNYIFEQKYQLNEIKFVLKN